MLSIKTIVNRTAAGVAVLSTGTTALSGYALYGGMNPATDPATGLGMVLTVFALGVVSAGTAAVSGVVYGMTRK
jgi:hypothetical protein